MIDSINELRGDEQCTEAVLIQERPSWALFAMLPVLVVAFLIARGLDLSGALAGALAGGLAGLTFAMLTTYWILARTGGDVVLARSSKLSAKATSIESTWPAPVATTVHGGMLSKKVSIGPGNYYIARQFTGRLNALVD